jgi:hypothetical protein
MLSLIFLPLELAIGFILLPLRIILEMLRCSRLMSIILIGGLCSVVFGIVSLILGSLQSLLPWILIVAGIVIICRANSDHPEARENVLKQLFGKKAAE